MIKSIVKLENVTVENKRKRKKVKEEKVKVKVIIDVGNIYVDFD